MNWKNQSVLVTGGNGFIGTNLVKRLVELRVPKIRVLDNMEREQINRLESIDNKIEFISGDLRNSKTCTSICDDVQIIFHLASKAGSNNYYKQNAFDVFSHNFQIDNQLLEAALIKNVIFFGYISSAFIYPFHLMQEPYGEPIIEDKAYPANPAISYGWAKLMGEKALQYAVEKNTGMKGAIFRLSNVYGPYQSINLKRGSIIPVLIRRAIEYSKLNPFLIYGEGSETRTYCYISDVIDAMVKAVENESECKVMGPYNIGGDDPISIKKLAELIIKISGKDITLTHKPSAPPVTLSQTLSSKLAMEELGGWQPKVKLEDGLSNMYQYVEDLMKTENI